MKNFNQLRRLGAVTAVTLAAIFGAAGTATGAGSTDDAKIARLGSARSSPTVGRASSLAEESALRTLARSVSGADSPGLFTTDAGQPMVRIFAGHSTAATRAVVQSHRAASQNSRFTPQAMKSLMRGLESASRRAGVSYEFHYDAQSDSILVTGNLDPSELPAAALGSGLVRLVKTTEGISRQGRYDDTPAFWGGGAILRSGSRCSTGFAVQKNGVRYLTTAGHCGTVGTSWTNGNGTRTVGTIVQRGAPYPSYDIALVGGATYGGYVFMGDRVGTPMKVLGAGNPTVGAFYCTSGTTTFENCGKKVVSTNATVCTAAGCTPGVAAYTGGAATQGGDSGGPLVLKTAAGVYARGSHIAAGGGTMYAELWSTFASHFGVSIVLG